MTLHHVVAHDLGLSRARAILDEAFAHYSDKYPRAQMKRTWRSEREATVDLQVGGFRLTPRLHVSDTEVVLDIDVPLLARPFVPKIKDKLDREVRFWLARSREP